MSKYAETMSGEELGNKLLKSVKEMKSGRSETSCKDARQEGYRKPAIQNVVAGSFALLLMDIRLFLLRRIDQGGGS